MKEYIYLGSSPVKPGYDEAAWGLDCPHDIAPIVEDRDDYERRWLDECRAHGETQRKLDAALALIGRLTPPACVTREARAPSEGVKVSILVLFLLACLALIALCMLPVIIGMAFEMMPLIIAIVIALAIYGWLT